MSAQQCLEIGNLLAIAGWLLLALAPRAWLTELLVRRHAIAILLASAYLALVVLNIGTLESANFNSLSGLRELFSNDGFLVAGWLHYLAFDLVIGAHIADDANRRGLSRFVMLPILFLTFYLGPIGFALYQLSKMRLSARKVSP